MKKIFVCKNCKNKGHSALFSLGDLCFSGKFAKKYSSEIPSDFITLVKCKKCNLVQLDRKFNQKYLYNLDYGYRSGINKTMKDHLGGITKKLSKLVKLNYGDLVLDIASNDATLLNSYRSKKIIKVGVDPILKKFTKFYKDIDFRMNGFFSAALIKKKIKKKFKIITACAVFYDIENPNKFLKDVSKIIDKEKGIFYLEFQDLLSIIKKKLFDTICHEHLEYYSLDVVNKMLKNNNLKLIDLYKNDINGGSISLIVSHSNGNYRINQKNIKDYLKLEKKYNLKKNLTYKKFYSEILVIKKKLKNIIDKLLLKKKIVHGYGASTKGNILLQFFNITNKQILKISDRNPEKTNLYTPGTKIKIISESSSRSINPDYYLVLPWHFKKEILQREKKIRKSGTKFIFPLPRLEIL